MHGVLASTVASTGEVGGANRSIVTGPPGLYAGSAKWRQIRERKHRTKGPIAGRTSFSTVIGGIQNNPCPNDDENNSHLCHTHSALNA